MIVFFDIILICDKLVKSRSDSESWDPMMDSLIDIAIYGLAGATVFQIITGFTPEKSRKVTKNEKTKSD
jgi:hypothetical protein